MKQTLILKRFLIAIFICFSAILVNAQDDPGDIGGDPGGTAQGWVPLDGGLAALLAAGVGYGAKKAYDYRTKRQKSSSLKMD
jgi:hypothetical protein